MGFGVWGWSLGFGVWGLGFGAANPEGVRRQVGDLREEGEGLLRDWGLGFRDWSWMLGVSGLRISNLILILLQILFICVWKFYRLSLIISR